MTAQVWGEHLAFANALLNGSSAVCLFAGYAAIRARAQRVHGLLMTAAFCCSALFLAGYLTRFALTGVHRFPIEGPLRAAYFTLLGSHTLMALVALPLVLRTMFLSAVRKDFAAHRRIAVWTFPVWAYVSVTGVLVYWMLYVLPARLHA